jgi:hypothetical protein
LGKLRLFKSEKVDNSKPFIPKLDFSQLKKNNTVKNVFNEFNDEFYSNMDAFSPSWRDEAMNIATYHH